MFTQTYQCHPNASARACERLLPGADHSGRRAISMAGRQIVIVLSMLMLVSCAPVATTVTVRTSARSAFDARLRALSVNQVIQRAVQHRLSLVARDPEALAIAVTTAAEPPGSVRAVLAGDVDEVAIVAWLVSFGVMGAWTAYNPQNAEAVNIPVSDIPALVARRPSAIGVYRLRDQKHLMLVRPVVVRDQAVGAVGYVLTQTYEDAVLAAEAVKLT